MTLVHFVKKHRMIIYPLMLVLIFDILLLITNYVLSAQLEGISSNINIAGRQRMLSQRMVKALLLSHDSQSKVVVTSPYLVELQETVALFDQTLNAFAVGGQVTDPSGHMFYLRPLTYPDIRRSVNEALFIWRPHALALNNFIMHRHLTEGEYDSLVGGLKDDNIALLNLMNQITNQLESRAKSKTYLLRGLQSLVIFMVALSFALAAWRVIRRERYYFNLMEKSTDLVVSVSVKTGRITFISASCFHLLGEGESAFVGELATKLFESESEQSFINMLTGLRQENQLREGRCETVLQTRAGKKIIADMVMGLVVGEDGKSSELYLDIRDISERKHAELELERLAHHDILTGLPNRAMFYEIAAKQIEMCRRNRTRLAILFIDLDGFKLINDRWGHDMGDHVLVKIGPRISHCLRRSDCVARLGGDEFIVLLSSIKDDTHIHAVGEKLIEAISVPVVNENVSCEVSASIGAAIFPVNGATAEALVTAADKAMYEAKRQGKGKICISSP